MKLIELLEVVNIDQKCRIFVDEKVCVKRIAVSTKKAVYDLKKEFRDDVMADWPVTFVSVNRDYEGEIVMSIFIMKPSQYEKEMKK